MLTLSDLSRKFPTEDEVKQLFPLFLAESDRGCAVVVGSFVEAGVHLACAARMVDDADLLDRAFHATGAPLGTFAAKIRMGASLGMYGPKTAEKLNLIKDIRNAFAHALRPLDFRNPTIVQACNVLDSTQLPAPMSGHAPARVRYTAFCWWIFNKLYEKAKAEGDREIIYELP